MAKLKDQKKRPAPKGQQESSRKRYKFTNFSTRIANIKIDPIRRSTHVVDLEKDADQLGSYFRSGLIKWNDLNLSEHFTLFSKEIDPLCDSLAQIIYHETKIVELLQKYLESGTSLSLEPLLELVVDFAHDLGQRFERHFVQLVTTVTTIASTNPDVEAVEWSFNCLAWIFKYLSKLLVPDLRPLFDLMSPLLGQERQKDFVKRFAAESFSYLIRRAAISYHKNNEPLSLIVNHICKIYSESEHDNARLTYAEGLGTLFSESIKGVNGHLSSNGEYVFDIILSNYLMSIENHQNIQQILTNILQQLTSVSTGPGLNIILSRVMIQALNSNSKTKAKCLNLLICAVEMPQSKTLINWGSMLDFVYQILSVSPSNEELEEVEDHIPSALTLLVACHIQEPLKESIKYRKLLTHLNHPHFESIFLDFCTLVLKAGDSQMFESILPSINNFLDKKWDKYPQKSYLILFNLLHKVSIQTMKFRIPFHMSFRTLNLYDRISDLPDQDLYELDILLQAHNTLKSEPAVAQSLASCLIDGILKFNDTNANPSSISLLYGESLSFISHCEFQVPHVEELWNRICKISSKLYKQKSFWFGIAKFTSHFSPNELASVSNIVVLRESIIIALQSPSGDIRQSALQVLQRVIDIKHVDFLKLIQLAILIDETKVNPHNSREISMKIRQLSNVFRESSSKMESWHIKTIQAFLFGLLRVKLAPVWDNACEAIGAFCVNDSIEKDVSDTAFKWLSNDTGVISLQEDSDESPSYFDANNSKSIQDLQKDVFYNSTTTRDILRLSFEQNHKVTNLTTDFDRSQALRLFNRLPHLAEKRSKQIVPILLKWVLDSDYEYTKHEDPNYEDSEHEGSEYKGSEYKYLQHENPKRQNLNSENQTNAFSIQRWNRKDQKEILGLFAKFVNPKALYKSEQVYEALSLLLTHADVDIQRASFNAILKWKNPTIVKYQSQINQFFDDAKFKEQILNFFSGESIEEALEEKDHPIVFPIVLRILYGRMIKRGTGNQKSNRKAILNLLVKLGESAFNEFLNIALGPLSQVSLISNGVLMESLLDEPLVPVRKQYGFLTMLKETLETLRTTATPYASRLLDPVIYCFFNGTSKSEKSDKNDMITEQSLKKTVRSLALTCLTDLFSISPDLDWKPYIPLLFERNITLRLDNIVEQNTQNVSGLLKLFSSWTTSSYCVPFLVNYEENLLLKLAECISSQVTKEEVKVYILDDILIPLLRICIEDSSQDKVINFISDNCGIFLDHLNEAMNKDCSKIFLELAIRVTLHLSELVPIPSPKILKTTSFLLKQPAMRVNSNSKNQLLEIISKSLKTIEIQQVLSSDMLLFNATFNVICSSFAMNVMGDGRALLSQILDQLSVIDISLRPIIQLVYDLNSMSETKLSLPNFKKRSKAFYAINEELYQEFTARQWTPILGNIQFFIKDIEELSIRASASHTLKRFIEATSEKTGEARVEFEILFHEMVYPSIESGIRHKNEIIRGEYVNIIGHVVKYLPKLPKFIDLQSLRWGGGGDGDEDEANFFTNILHIQQHRRVRALKRLIEQVGKGTVSPNNISHLLIPLLESFIFESTDGVIAGESSKAIGSLSEWMDFPQYRSLMKRYVSYIQSKSEIQETILKLLNNVASSLSHCALARKHEYQETTLYKTLPSQDKLPGIISTEVLPKFYKFLQEKDESFVSRRIAAANVAAKIMQILPPEEFSLRFPPLLAETCNILKSRDQNSRDATRNALADMCQLVGPAAIGFVVKELRRALQRGFYLHVLGFTVHSILECCLENINPGDLDYCTEDVVAVVMDDIFGSAGQEKEIVEYLKNSTGKREIKGRKSFDTIQMLASKASLSRMVDLVRPIELLLMERVNHKMLRDVDEFLRRVEIGVMHNPSFKDRDILVFCYQIIQDAYKVAESEIVVRKNLRETSMAPLPKPKKAEVSNAFSNRTRIGKIVRFGLDLVRSILKRHKDLKTPENIAGFLPVIQDAFDQSQEDIKLAAIRLFTFIIGVPHAKMDSYATSYITKCVAIIDEVNSTGEELAQACLKLVAAVLRERKSISIPESSIALLLDKIKPDLQIISQQGVAFNLIRAMISRKIIVAEIYELVDGEDGIASISIRDQDRTTRDLARGVYFQFIMEFPQGKKRFNKQLTFLVRNLEYEFPEGRQSVMEALNHLLNKVDDDLANTIVQQSFWPVVSVMINDTSEDCRFMASGLIKTIFTRADEEWCHGFLKLFRKMMDENSSSIQKRTGLQCWMAYCKVQDHTSKELAFVLQSLENLLKADNGTTKDTNQIHYFALQTLQTIIEQKNSSQAVFSEQCHGLWYLVEQKLSLKQGSIQLEAAKTIDKLICEIKGGKSSSLSATPIVLSNGLQITQTELCDLTHRHLTLLREDIATDLASLAIKNLVFFGQVFIASGDQWRKTDQRKRGGRSRSQGLHDDEHGLDNDGNDNPNEITAHNNDDPNEPNHNLETENENDHPSSEDEPSATSNYSAISHLLHRLATILRRDPRRPAATTPTAGLPMALPAHAAALHTLAALVGAVPAATLLETDSLLPAVLRPLLHLTGGAAGTQGTSGVSGTSLSSVAGEVRESEAWSQLVRGAQEVLDGLQRRVGTSAFVQAVGRVQKAVGEKREERRRKRRVDVLLDAERMQRYKIRKREKGKERRKLLGLVERGKRRGW